MLAKMNRILILGGNGLIGSKLQLMLSKSSDYSVRNIDKDTIDLCSENIISSFQEQIEDFDPTITIVLAAVKRQLGDNIDTMKKNNMITKNITNCLSNTSSKVIYLSSCAVFGEKNQQDNYTEESPISPTSNYGEHKSLSERAYVSQIDSKRLLILRPPLIYDLFETSGYHPGGFLYSSIKDKKIQIWGNGVELRDFLYLEDACNVIIDLIKREVTGIINLTTGNSFSYINIAQHIAQKMEISIIERPRTGVIVNHTYNNSKLMSYLPEYIFKSPIEILSSYFE